mmetsp:Transcript_23010/g.64039  ORF Transcript_23010/g.64039 Transcript_23010/m.64039 type:complete len:270 (+) Transcript_23010:71-880(+)|eukprot:CAMPEP_0168749550 /NCGR_PEP_ID=MMETSP0724-20121128/16776_1 /TAXON_ID=265536 /ORGANISM="Amphiprora sp., Strain CCMP467" /LENGTH=269 /DNA_ID=CAMNT_0008797467 /DNA_START=217 /DNA_END=1026 /DNA_ORIENTATION=-
MKIQSAASASILLLLPVISRAFQSVGYHSHTVVRTANAATTTSTSLWAVQNNKADSSSSSILSRRRVFAQSLTAAMLLGTTTTTTTLVASPAPAYAATRAPLGDLLYTVLRVREATEQETRLIKSGKFKDIQRANIKLAVKFMVENYRLADTVVAAATYIDGTDRRMAATNLGQTTVQDLQTIMEYFDSSDVQNLKVGATSLAGKEQLVLRGLDAARKSLDDFLAFFPASEVDAARQKLLAENALNEKEFDPDLGVIINLRQQQATATQ